MPYSDYPHGSIAARGEQIYQQQLREKVESEHKGKFLSIDIETGAYEINADEVTSSMTLLEKHPEAVLYCVRIGFPAAHRIGFKIIATNYHVIAGAASGTAKLVGKSTTYKIEGVTTTNKYNDLALLKVSAFGIKPLSIGNSDAVKIGETVYVAGNPKGLEGTFSDGIIISRRGAHAKGRLQMTAPISPGSSGGPVLNRKGEVIGVSFMTLEGGQNLNFAIPSRYLKTLLAQSGRVKSLSRGNHSISAEIYFARGNTKMSLGQYLAAVSDDDKVIHLKPDAANAYYNRGIAKRKLGQHFAAITDFDKVIQIK